MAIHEPLPRPAAAALTHRARTVRQVREGGIVTLLVLCALFSLAITGTIIGVLLSEAARFFGQPGVGLGEFFLTTTWNISDRAQAVGGEQYCGIWPLVSGTLVITGVAMAVALPLGLVTAIYLSEYAPRRLRAVLKPALEVLAGIPTVVYGFFALTIITPGLKLLHEGFNVYNAFSAGVAVGILCLPIVSSLAEDALQAVPRGLRDAAYGLGGTKFDVAVKVVVPAALSGIVSAFLLAIARAIGETMIVALAAGSRAHLSFDPRDDMQPMTGYMVQAALGDVSLGGIEYLSLYAVAAALFVLTFTLTVVGQIIRRRYREVYS